MDSMTLIAIASIVIAGITTSLGCVAPALAEGRSVASALTGPTPSITAATALWPDISPTSWLK